MSQNQTTTNAARETGQKNVVITFHDGEVTTERNVDEVHDGEDTLFLRRNGKAGTSFDKCDIKSFEVLAASDDIFDATTNASAATTAQMFILELTQGEAEAVGMALMRLRRELKADICHSEELLTRVCEAYVKLDNCQHMNGSAVRFVKDAEGMDWTKHNEARSLELSAKATSLMMPANIFQKIVH